MQRHLRYARDLWRAGRKHQLSPGVALARFWRLATSAQFSPNEIFRLGLLDERDAFARMSRTISKEALLRLQNDLNPREHFRLTEDKLDFEEACRAHALPVPPMIATCSPSGRRIDGVPAFADAGAFVAFLGEAASREIVVKPAGGTHGRGVLVLSRRDDGTFDGGDRVHDAAGMTRLIAASGYDDWLAQQRLFGARELAALSGTDLLQTARVVSLAPDRDSPSVLLAWLRITAGPSRSDNFNFGAAGHLVAPIDVDSGRLGTPARMSVDGFGLEPAVTHPRTGARIEGFRVPHWRALVALVERAAECFRPLRTIGWDVAITDDGPRLIEGNVTWDPLPANPGLAAALGPLRAARPAH